MIDYTEKLEAIIAENDIKSLTILRMEVPCAAELKWQRKAHCKTAANSSVECGDDFNEGEIL